MVNHLNGSFMDPGEFHQTRMELLNQLGITVFLDGGANTGAFASHIRHSGFGGTIISFEPAPVEYNLLTQLALHDPDWECHQVALGDEEREALFHLAGNSESSSLLPMTEHHLTSAPESRYVGTETVRVTQLDTLCSTLLSSSPRIYMKLDLQGNEQAALRGAGNLLKHTVAIEIELACKKLYDGQLLYKDMIALLDSRGFRMFGYEHNFVDPNTHEVLEVNAIFLKDEGME